MGLTLGHVLLKGRSNLETMSGSQHEAPGRDAVTVPQRPPDWLQPISARSVPDTTLDLVLQQQRSYGLEEYVPGSSAAAAAEMWTTATLSRNPLWLDAETTRVLFAMSRSIPEETTIDSVWESVRVDPRLAKFTSCGVCWFEDGLAVDSEVVEQLALLNVGAMPEQDFDVASGEVRRLLTVMKGLAWLSYEEPSPSGLPMSRVMFAPIHQRLRQGHASLVTFAWRPERSIGDFASLSDMPDGTATSTNWVVPGPAHRLLVLRLFTSMFALLQQKMLTVSEQRPPRHVRKRVHRGGAPIDTVLLVSLARAPEAGPRVGGQPVEWSHRWLVGWPDGSWRMQPYGPGNTLRRPTWIAPYIKGPADKDLMIKDRVTVVRTPGEPTDAQP